MDKPVLDLSIHDSSQLRELIENHEVYGEALIDLIQHLYYQRDEYNFQDFSYTDEFFTLRV